MNKLQRLIVKATAIATLLTPSFAKSQEKINPFVQPNDSTLNYYGSGDVNNDNQINYSDVARLDSLIAGTFSDSSDIRLNDRADVNGDEILDSEDRTLLQDHLDLGNYLPSDWNNLQTREQRQSWLDKMLTIDKTDTLKWVGGEWVSGNFSMQHHINFHGFNGEIPLESKYDFTNNQRFNLPLYSTAVTKPWHGITSILIGDNPLDWNDWYFNEPQNDTKVEIGGWNLNENSEVRIGQIYKLYTDGYKSQDFIKFKITDGVPSLAWYDTTNLVLEDVVNSIGSDKPIIAENFSLGNYPNPFNSNTTINYNLERPGNVMLKVYNVKGQELETLVNQFQTSGDYSINFDAQKYASGIYFYRLHTGDAVETKKMIYVK